MTGIESGIASGEFRADLPAECCTASSAMPSWLSLRWFSPTAEFGMDHLADSVVSVFLERHRSPALIRVAVGNRPLYPGLMSAPSRPTFGQYVGYQFGRTLPDSLQDWVRRDLVGPGASARYLIRFTRPLLPILALFLLIPGPIWVPLAMMALLVHPARVLRGGPDAGVPATSAAQPRTRSGSGGREGAAPRRRGCATTTNVATGRLTTASYRRVNYG